MIDTPCPFFLLLQATSCWGSTKGGKEEQRHKKVLEDLVNGKHEEENPRSLMKSDKSTGGQSGQSGQQNVFAARTLPGWQLRVFGKEQDIK